jgi:hypothetical protein
MGCKLNTYPCYCTKYEFYTGLGACSLACGEEVDLEVSEWRNIFCQAGAGAPAYTPIVDPLAAPTGTNGTGSGACTDPMICPMPIPVKASPVPVVPVVVAPVPKTVVPSSPSVPKAGSSSLPKSGGPVKGQGAAKGPFVPKGQRPKGPYVDFEN